MSPGRADWRTSTMAGWRGGTRDIYCRLHSPRPHICSCPFDTRCKHARRALEYVLAAAGAVPELDLSGSGPCCSPACRSYFQTASAVVSQGAQRSWTVTTGKGTSRAPLPGEGVSGESSFFTELSERICGVNLHLFVRLSCAYAISSAERSRRARHRSFDCNLNTPALVSSSALPPTHPLVPIFLLLFHL